jgi:hypothetical protein
VQVEDAARHDPHATFAREFGQAIAETGAGQFEPGEEPAVGLSDRASGRQELAGRSCCSAA